MNGPVIGYIGWLNSLRLDDDLICYIAKSKPSWNFVFVGPKSDRYPLGKAEGLDNVIVLDPVEYRRLYGIYDVFDVCILPNRINEHTSGNDPIKIYDYLASGKPVVSTRTAGVERVEDSICIADDNDEFVCLLEKALNEKMQFCDARRTVAYHNSWQKRADDLFLLLKTVAV